MNILELVGYEYIGKALLVGFFLGVSGALLGVLLVLRNLSLLGSSIGHGAFGGIALAVLLGLDPILGAIFFVILLAIVLSRIVVNVKGDIEGGGDIGLAVISSLGMAIAIIILSKLRSTTLNISSYLFGSILLVSTEDILLSSALLTLTILFFLWKYKEIRWLLLDYEIAKIKGIKTSAIILFIILLSSIFVVISARSIGLLLSSAFLVLPAYSSLLISSSLSSTFIFSVIFSTFSVIAGMLISLIFDLPTSATIVSIMLFILVLIRSYKYLCKFLQR